MIDPLQLLLEQAAGSVSRFPENSRYRHVPVVAESLPDGSSISYLQRRFVPHPEQLAMIAEHTLVAGDRLDNLAMRYHGDPELFWQIADANRAMRPDELTENTDPSHSKTLRITLPAGVPAQPKM